MFTAKKKTEAENQVNLWVRINMVNMSLSLKNVRASEFKQQKTGESGYQLYSNYWMRQ